VRCAEDVFEASDVGLEPVVWEGRKAMKGRKEAVVSSLSSFLL